MDRFENPIASPAMPRLIKPLSEKEGLEAMADFMMPELEVTSNGPRYWDGAAS